MLFVQVFLEYTIDCAYESAYKDILYEIGRSDLVASKDVLIETKSCS
jgi:hypothetical protein